MGDNIMSYARSISNPHIDWPEEAKLKGTFAEDLQRVLPLVQKAANISLTETDRKTLESVHNPFYRDAILKMLENAQIALKEVEGKAIIEKTPEVAPDKLFEAIIAHYKGKVILVDFWNTWCGPCRMVAPIMKELAKEYADKIVVYKVNVDKEKELAALFNATSIPLFVFIPMNGEPQLFRGAADKATYKKAIDDFLLKTE